MGRRSKTAADKAVSHPWIPKGKKIYVVSYLDATRTEEYPIGRLVQRTTGTSNLEDAKALLAKWKTEVFTGGKHRHFNYKDSDLNKVIDEAVADKRILKGEAKEIKALDQAEKRIKIQHWFEVKDGKLVYILKPMSSPKVFPWREVPSDITSLPEYTKSKNRVKAKINSIIGDLSEKEALKLMALRNNIVNVKTIEDVLDWERVFNDYHTPLRKKVTLSKVPKNWAEIAQSSIDADIDSWIRKKIHSSAKRTFASYPEVQAGKVSASQLATEFINNLSVAEYAEWDKTYRPIKLMNDAWWQVAIDSGNPAYLDNIIEGHHILPLKAPGGTGLKPTNIAGAQGSGFNFSTEHGRQHTPFARILFRDIAATGATELYYNPPGLGDIETKISKPRWDAKSGKVVYDLLGADEWVKGVPEYIPSTTDPYQGAGMSDAPQDAPQDAPSVKGGRTKTPLNRYTLPIIAAATLGGAVGFSKESVADTLKSGWFWGDMATGFDTEGIAKGMQQLKFERDKETYGDEWVRFKNFAGGLLTGDWARPSLWKGVRGEDWHQDDRTKWIRAWESPKRKKEKLESIWT